MENEGPYRTGDATCIVFRVGVGEAENFDSERDALNASRLANTAYAEGRKSMEKEIEEKKAIKDTLLCGTGFVMEGKRVPPEDVYLSETEIKLQKVEKEFKELLSIAEMMCTDIDYGSDGTAAFVDWKKARVI